MDTLSFLKKQLKWKKIFNISYQKFELSQLDTIKQFISNNKNYNYFIILNKILVIKINARKHKYPKL